MLPVDLSIEAINCLKFWNEHPEYGGTFSDVVLTQMEEWLCRDMTSATNEEVAAEFERIKKGG